jgi:hypothetical protein
MEQKRLIISSGGQMGIAIIGAIRSLERHLNCSKLSERFDSFEGTSAGALVSFMLSIGFSSFEILMFYQSMPEIRPDITAISKKLGLVNLKNIIKQPIENVLSSHSTFPIGADELSSITFEELELRTGKKLVLGITIISPYEDDLGASSDNCAKWSVFSTLVASMAIPAIFEPVEIDTGSTPPVFAIDGGISNTFRFPRLLPTHFENSKTSIVGILLQQETGTTGFKMNTFNPWEYLLFISSRFFYYLSRSKRQDYENLPVIIIPCEISNTGIIMKPDTNTFIKLINRGEIETNNFFSKWSLSS